LNQGINTEGGQKYVYYFNHPSFLAIPDSKESSYGTIYKRDAIDMGKFDWKNYNRHNPDSYCNHLVIDSIGWFFG
jgi:hypothetical protein